MLVRVWGAIGLASIAWGTNGVATRAALNDGVPPVAMVAIRSLLAAALLAVLLQMRRRPIPTSIASWSKGLVQGVFQLSVPFVLFTLAYENASAGFVGLFAALIPLGTAIVAHYMLPDEPLHLAKSLGLAVAFAGVAFLLLSGDSGLGEGGKPLVAAGLSLAAVVAISYAGVYAKSHADRFDPMELAFMQFVFGVVLIGLTMLAFEGIPGAISLWGWVLIGYMTVVGSVLPFLLFFWLLQQVSVTKASLVGYIVPLVALFAGIVLLDEKLQLGIGVGGLLILVGVILTDRAERRTPSTAHLP
jgi:drug/metabolite transporter (DMT)-like permease